MVNIKIDPNQQSALRHGDIKVLREVLEAEIDKATSSLIEAGSPELFRFQQGQIQALQGILRLLP